MKISLTDFVDVVVASGTPKTSAVLGLLNRPSYHPAKDYWKQARETIISIHRNGEDKEVLDLALERVNEKRLSNYVTVINAYKKWLGRKRLGWFEPPSHVLSVPGVKINVNPELGLVLDDGMVATKLYFKAEKLTRSTADIIIHVMKRAIPDCSMEFGVLDVRRSRLYRANKQPINIDAAIDGELAYITTVLAKVS